MVLPIKKGTEVSSATDVIERPALLSILLSFNRKNAFWLRVHVAVHTTYAGWSRGCWAHLTLCCCWNGEFSLFPFLPYSSVFHCTPSLTSLPIPPLSFFRPLLASCSLVTWQKDQQGWSSTKYVAELGARSRQGQGRDGTSLFSDGELRHRLRHWQTYLSHC